MAGIKLALSAALLQVASAAKNVLFMLEDDGGFDMAAYGNSIIDMPVLNGFAQTATIFDAMHTTVSSCSPSRAAIMTGLPTHQNGMIGLEQLPFNFATYNVARSLPNILNAAGYETALLGKYHVQPIPVFNYSWGILPDSPRCCGASDACASVPYNTMARNITYMKECASDFLTYSTQQQKPWFMYIGWGDSHRCGGPQGAFCELYGLDQATNKSLIPDWTPHVYDPSAVQLPFFVQDTPEARGDVAKMWTVKNRMDQGIGLMLDMLAQRGLMNDTLVIYTADNGIPFAMGKTNFYEPGSGEPLLMYVPGVAGGARVSVPVSTLDILPTILDWVGVPFTPYTMNGEKVNLTGRSILPLVREAAEQHAARGSSEQQQFVHPYFTGAGRAAPAPPPPVPSNATRIYGSFQVHEVSEYYPMRVVRADRYKLIYNIARWLPYPIASDLYAADAFQDLINRASKGMPSNWYRNITTYMGTPRPQWELFDIEADPQENTNLASDPDYADILSTLQNDIKTWQFATNDYWTIKYTHE